MNFLSIAKIAKEIENIINANTQGSLIGLISNQYAGLDKLHEMLIKNSEKYSATRHLKLKANQLIEIDKFADYLNNEMNIEFGKHDPNICRGHDLSDIMMNFLKIYCEEKIKSVLFVIEDFGLLNIEQQYKIGSQFRNLREKLKFSELAIGLHTILSGNFSFYSIEKHTNSFGTSSILDSFFYIEKSCFEEFVLLYGYGNSDAIDEIKLSTSVEYCNGVWDQTLSFYTKLSEGLSDENVVKHLMLQDGYIIPISTQISGLSNYQKDILINILNGYEIHTKFNKQIESLYLLGVITINSYKDIYKINIRNWLYDNLLRNLLSKNIYNKSNEVIAPVITNNLKAYEIILRIENKFKNILLFILSKFEFEDHPLQVLDFFGKVKYKPLINSNEKIDYTYYEWCKNKSDQLKVKYDIKTHNTLISFLDIKDLKDIVSSNCVDPRYCDILTELERYFPNKDEVKKHLEDLRRIRNPIAHNNLINEPVINELKNIEKNLFKKTKIIN